MPKDETAAEGALPVGPSNPPREFAASAWHALGLLPTVAMAGVMLGLTAGFARHQAALWALSTGTLCALMVVLSIVLGRRMFTPGRLGNVWTLAGALISLVGLYVTLTGDVDEAFWSRDLALMMLWSIGLSFALADILQGEFRKPSGA